MMARAATRRLTPAEAAAAPILVLTGLAREAVCVTGDGTTVLCSGADVAVLRAALARMQGVRFSCVVSFGLAGGLDHALRPGDALIGVEAVAGATRTATDERLSAVLAEGLASAGVKTSRGAVAGVDQPVMTVRAKAALRDATQAAAVDMESHIAAQYAAARGLPLAILRVVGDPASRALPPLAASAVRPDGGVDISRVLRELIREPAQIGDLIRAGLDARAAFSTLGRCGPLLGPLLRLVLADL
jgi:hopanoid-associated phosphorylase